MRHRVTDVYHPLVLLMAERHAPKLRFVELVGGRADRRYRPRVHDRYSARMFGAPHGTLRVAAWRGESFLRLRTGHDPRQMCLGILAGLVAPDLAVVQ
jgi:hypothetical protein